MAKARKSDGKREGKRDAQREAKREAKHDGKRDGERRLNISLAMRLALLIAGMVAVFMLGFGLFLRGFIRDAVKEQVRYSAWEAAATAAHADLDAWTDYFGTQHQGLTPEQVQHIADGMEPQEYKAMFEAPAYVRMLGWNQSRLKRFLEEGSRIVAVELLSPETPPRRLAQSYDSALMQFEPFADQQPLKIPRGAASEGTLTTGVETLHAIRGSYPVLDADGNVRAEFAVYIKAVAIEEATAHLMTQVMISAAAFVLVGAGIAYVVGRRITRPITLLQEDMAIVAAGELEHRTEAHSGDEVGSLAQSFDDMTQRLLEARRAERDSAAGRHQMSVAGEIATSLFPTRLPEIEGYDLAGHHEASAQLSGEYYDVLPLAGGRYGFLVGAASGSGVPAAMVMAMARSFLAAVARSETDPGKILRDVNALLSGDLRRGMYVTVLLAVLDPAAGTLTIANAGHAPLLLWRGSQSKLSPVQSEGIALGFDKGPVFDGTLKVVRLRLQDGDRVVLFTPGVTRVAGGDGSALGEERFAGLIRREAGNPAALFMRRMAGVVKKFRGERPLSEDITLLTLGRPQPGAVAGSDAAGGGDGGAEDGEPA